MCVRAYTNAFILDGLIKDDAYENKDEAKKLLAEYDIEHRRFYGSERSHIPTLGTGCARFFDEVRNKAANNKGKKDALSQIIDISKRADKVIAKSSTINIQFRPCEPMFCVDDGIDEMSKMILDELKKNEYEYFKVECGVVNYQYSFINGGTETVKDLHRYYSEGKRDPNFIRTPKANLQTAEAGGGG